MQKKTDIQIMKENAEKMSKMSKVDVFEFMKKKNLQASQAPWAWDRIDRRHCSRCGSDKVYERKSGNASLRLTQCTGAVRYFSISRKEVML